MFSRNVTMFVSRGGMNRGPLWCYVSHMSSGGAGKYAGKVVIVSGASSGIGEEVSLQYAKQGANLVVSARREEKLTDVADRCRQAAIDAGTSGSTKAVVADVSVEEDCKRMVAAAVTQFGGVDILVLNAGVGQSFFLEAMQPDVNIRQFMDVNYYGCVYPTIAALPHLQESASGGRIVVVSSLGGLIPFPRQTLYNASKYALLGFFDTLRMELQSRRSTISISTICPGFIKTEITAGGGLGRDGKPVGTSMDPTAVNKGAVNGKKKSAGGGVAMISAADCATQVIEAADARRHTTIVPKYPYSIIYTLRKFFPAAIDALLIKMYAPPPQKKL